MITELISKIAVWILATTAYAGAFILMALESMIAPVPSEAVMPFVGFLVTDGKWNLWLAVLSTSLGSLAGSLLSYWMGYYGGKPLVLKVGKYLLLNRHDLEWTERYFNQRQGLLTVFAARFIPVVRHFISIAAGLLNCWHGHLLNSGRRLHLIPAERHEPRGQAIRLDPFEDQGMGFAFEPLSKKRSCSCGAKGVRVILHFQKALKGRPKVAIRVSAI